MYKYRGKGMANASGNETISTGKVTNKKRKNSIVNPVRSKLAPPNVQLDKDQILGLGLDFIGFQNRRNISLALNTDTF
jgi:hypothetical protein